jgi:hypothetical protein
MSDPTHLFTQPPIRVIFAPYDHDSVQEYLKQVVKDFGRPGTCWRYRSPDIGQMYNNTEPNVWQLDFFFANPHDALIFGLKYQR